MSGRHRVAGVANDAAGDELDDLDSRVERPSSGATDEDWSDALLVWNGMVSRVPRAVPGRSTEGHPGDPGRRIG